MSRKIKGLIQVYTGEGKGKTTQAVGQAVRARGHHLKVCFVHFFKDPEKFPYGEDRILRKIGVKVLHLVPRHPHFYRLMPKALIRKQCLEALKKIGRLFKGKIDLLILDELNIALRDGFLKEEEVCSLLKQKPAQLEIILTGRGLKRGIKACADLISEVKKIKHPFDKGISARRAIEY